MFQAIYDLRIHVEQRCDRRCRKPKKNIFNAKGKENNDGADYADNKGLSP